MSSDTVHLTRHTQLRLFSHTIFPPPLSRSECDNNHLCHNIILYSISEHQHTRCPLISPLTSTFLISRSCFRILNALVYFPSRPPHTLYWLYPHYYLFITTPVFTLPPSIFIRRVFLLVSSYYFAAISRQRSSRLPATLHSGRQTARRVSYEDLWSCSFGGFDFLPLKKEKKKETPRGGPLFVRGPR